MAIKTTFFVMLLAACIVSCKTPCTNPNNVEIEFNGYDSTALRVVVIKKYPKNGSFSGQIDSGVVVRFSRPDSLGSYEHGDTIFYNTQYVGGDFPYSIDYNYDYIVTLPAASATYKISGISFGKQKTEDSNHGCVNSMSCSVNGNGQTYPTNYQTNLAGVSVVINK